MKSLPHPTAALNRFANEFADWAGKADRAESGHVQEPQAACDGTRAVDLRKLCNAAQAAQDRALYYDTLRDVCRDFDLWERALAAGRRALHEATEHRQPDDLLPIAERAVAAMQERAMRRAWGRISRPPPSPRPRRCLRFARHAAASNDAEVSHAAA
jgi:hypothetical protein